MDNRINKAEQREIERHKWIMSEAYGADVGIERATEDWLTHCAEEWRRSRQAHMLEMQRHEIERYKWIESEKAQRDLGRDAALDWIKKYAARWRDWYEAEYGGNEGEFHRVESPSCSTA
ncbi:MAG: hypothetical protein HYV26_12785 [Candidatus Hydrogenedentes bacterium]|nr:hypothetical protein [Candidatus Hydrogenedentota bacterium]